MLICQRSSFWYSCIWVIDFLARGCTRYVTSNLSLHAGRRGGRGARGTRWWTPACSSYGALADCTIAAASSVPVFLVKNLLLPWQWGLKHFWDCLLDADLECDALGWQYCSGCLAGKTLLASTLKGPASLQSCKPAGLPSGTNEVLRLAACHKTGCEFQE